MHLFDGSIGLGTVALLALCLGVALGFEFVNGFHDTANAVATVIYTHSLKPWIAVVWSGLMNFLGVMLGGVAVAYSIVHLLPVDLVINSGSATGLLMVLSLLVSAILWNFGTWYLGLPSSSSHALIGSILGVGIASSLLSGQGLSGGVNWSKAQQVALSLMISPLVGFVLAGGLLLLAKAFIKDQRLYDEPHGTTPPPFWVRATLIFTCTGVSFAHGSNDGQKGVGLIMLILIGILPTHYALNPTYDAAQVQHALAGLPASQSILTRLHGNPDADEATAALQRIQTVLNRTVDVQSLTTPERVALRSDILLADHGMHELKHASAVVLTSVDRDILRQTHRALRPAVDFVATWVVVAVALALGIGTTVGWKRIVITVGEKIGKTHLSYAQGASAEVVAMTTIAAADLLGLPVSTTHVLSSGVAGTMAANQSGLQLQTVRNIALAWILTLPATLLIAGVLFASTAGGTIKEVNRPAIAASAKGVLPQLE